MAILENHSQFLIKITPRYANWWSFDFEFIYRDKPVFNPEITRGSVFSADEYESWKLLPVFEEAINCRIDEKDFFWSAWEDEVVVHIKSFMKNLDKDLDGGFEFTVFVAEQLFAEGEMNYMFKNAGVEVFVSREEIKKFYSDLKSEMEKIHPL